MRKNYVGLFILFGAVMTSCGPEKINYPVASRGDQTDTYFGKQVADPYRWLEDDNSAETAEWVAAENKITGDYLSKIPFRDALKTRLETIWNYPKYGVPFKKGNRYFFSKNDGLQNQGVLYMQESIDAEPQLLLDPNKLSEDGTIALAGMSPSKDGKLLAYSISRGGSDWSEIVVMKIDDRSMLPDTINWVKFSGISWYGDGFFYSAYDAPAPGQALSGSNEFHKVFYHKLGTAQSADEIIFQDKVNPQRNFYAQLTEDDRFLIIGESQSTSGNALYIKDLQAKNPTFVKLANGFEYDYSVVDHIDGKILIQTNDGAPMQHLVLVDPANPARENWQVIIPESKNVLQSVSMVGELMLAEYLEDAYSKAYFYDYTGAMVKEMTLPAIGTLAGFSGEKGDSLAFFGFTSFTFPSSVYTYNMDSHTSAVYTKSDVDFDPEAYTTEQVFYPSKDGTKIPMFLVYKKGLVKNGNNPVLLYGYGGFNISLTPSFSISRLPFLEQGGVYVTVNLRGGGEYGEAWHKAGTKLSKQNVFDDFIGAAEFLIAEKYTRPDKIAILGGSNGGLLVGACMTQRPELFKVAIPIVGVMDMLR
ncbi:MAG: prolyl oligopeptidase family serine peptidase, partial [Bacteroidetes bacterium]|nr:prolyl oligopeptidase family serine peptidase [Bacteroidota bacterium]